jgi:hypothetical protein
MPFLPIDSTIVSNPGRHHLSIIESWMLWPDDEANRRDAYNSAVVAIGRELERETRRTVLDELFDLAADAKPLGQMQELAKKQIPKGAIAGQILIAAIIGRDADGDRLKLGDIHKMLRGKFSKQGGNDSKFVNEIWTRYRPVSHLWAAHIEFRESGRRVFPCEQKDVIEFLWLSEDWRKKGELTKTSPKAPSTILKPGECVRVPETMLFSK